MFRIQNIWGKIFFSFISITLITVTAVGVLLNISFEERFTEYVKSNLNQKHQNVVLYIQNSLESEISSHVFFMNLSHFSVMENVGVQFFTKEGELLFDSALSGSMMMPSYVREKKEDSGKAYMTEKWIEINGTQMKVRVISELSQGLWSPQDLTFRQAIYYSLLGSLAIGLLLAVVFSVFTSSMITRPVTTLKKAALLISRGDWKTRVDIHSDDELRDLGDSFNKMAQDLEHLETLRRKMTSDIAHELRNPLMSIQNYIEGMIDRVIEPDEVHLKDLHEEVQRLTGLIENLNKLVQLEARRQINSEQFDLVLEFTAYFKRFKLDYEAKGINFSWYVEDVEVNLDKYILKEILQNLLENARKYTLPDGEVFCSLKKSKEEGQGGLKIEITDTGIGIEEKNLPYIFERFYRVDPSRARQTGGTGIGLAITRELVELIRGDIQVESKLGIGTRFIVFLPFMK